MSEYKEAYSGLVYRLKHANSDDFFPTSDKKWDESTEEQRDQWKQEAIKRDEYERDLRSEIRKQWDSIIASIDVIYGNHTNYKGKPIDWATKEGHLIKNYLKKYAPFATQRRHFQMWERCENARLKRVEQVEKEKVQAQKEIDKKNDHLQQIIQLTVIATKNGLDPELSTDPFELLLELEKKDHRLPLAISMKNARGDFYEIDGVAREIKNFQIKDGTDKAIYEDVSECFSDGEYPSDGRVFRDIEWSYDAIYNLVDDTLMEDVRVVLDVIRKKKYGW